MRQASTAADDLGVFGRGESSPNQEKVSMPFPVPVFLKIIQTLHPAAFRTKRHPSKSGALNFL